MLTVRQIIGFIMIGAGIGIAVEETVGCVQEERRIRKMENEIDAMRERIQENIDLHAPLFTDDEKDTLRLNGYKI